MTGPKVVAFGGGHGLAASLTALRHVTDNITAVVTVADDGGSSGRLREEFNVLPPGDLRMALAALCDDSEWGHTWRDVLQHRFHGDGPLGGHSLGNLLIVSLWDLHGDTVDGLDLVGRLLNARGRVLPMAAEPLDIVADIYGGEGMPDTVGQVRGQHRVASATGLVQSVRLVPENPKACPQTIEAIAAADWLVLGPGSWFTSVLPHVMVPDLRAALVHSGARRILNLNLEVNRGESAGYRAHDHVRSLAEHAPDLRIDIVLVDPRIVDDYATLTDAAALLGARLSIQSVSSSTQPGVHDTLRLAAAYRDLMTF